MVLHNYNVYIPEPRAKKSLKHTFTAKLIYRLYTQHCNVKIHLLTRLSDMNLNTNIDAIH